MGRWPGPCPFRDRGPALGALWTLAWGSPHCMHQSHRGHQRLRGTQARHPAPSTLCQWAPSAGLQGLLDFLLRLLVRRPCLRGSQELEPKLHPSAGAGYVAQDFPTRTFWIFSLPLLLSQLVGLSTSLNPGSSLPSNPDVPHTHWFPEG